MEATANYYKGRDSQRGRRTKSTSNANWRGGQDQALEQGEDGVGRRKLPTVTTANLASGYANTPTGGTLELTAGTYGGVMRNDDGGVGVGVYFEKEVSFVCTADIHVCILDGEDDHRVVFTNLGSGSAFSLTGLKIMRGGGGGYGAGVMIYSGSVTMNDCFISDNTATGSNVS